MRARLPDAVELVYDTYNSLAIGFGLSEKASDAIFSIVRYPRYVTLFFLQGVHVPDPKQLRQGSGNVVRRIKLELTTDLDKPAIRELMAAALTSAKRAIARNRSRRNGAPAKSRSLSVCCGANQAKM